MRAIREENQHINIFLLEPQIKIAGRVIRPPPKEAVVWGELIRGLMGLVSR